MSATMSAKTSSPLTTLAPIIFSLLIGGLGGYYVRAATPIAPTGATQAAAPGGGGGGPGGLGGPPKASALLPRLVRSLATIEQVQGKGLTADQKKSLMPLLQQIQSADKLSETDCTEKLNAIQAVLGSNTPQQEALNVLQPPRPAGGAGGAGGRPGGGGGQPGGAGGAGGRPGGGGGQPGGAGGRPDPERPFASGRSKQSLQDLITAAQQP